LACRFCCWHIQKNLKIFTLLRTFLMLALSCVNFINLFSIMMWAMSRSPFNSKFPTTFRSFNLYSWITQDKLTQIHLSFALRGIGSNPLLRIYKILFLIWVQNTKPISYLLLRKQKKNPIISCMCSRSKLTEQTNLSHYSDIIFVFIISHSLC
jgi:hypothetical protein